MIERLSGTFKSLRKYSELRELIDVIKSVRSADKVIRLHIYSGTDQNLLIIYVDEKNSYCTIYDAESSSFRGISEVKCSDIIPDSGYVEVYELTPYQFILDNEVISSAALASGAEPNELITKFSIESIEKSLPTRVSESLTARDDVETTSPPTTRDGKEPRCSLIIRTVMESFIDGGSLGKRDISGILKYPSVIGSIILNTKQHTLKIVPCSEILRYLEPLMSENDYLAIKLEIGGFNAWLMRLGDMRGARAVSGNMARSGEKILVSWKDFANIINRAAKSGEGITVYVYILSESIMGKGMRKIIEREATNSSGNPSDQGLLRAGGGGRSSSPISITK